MTHQCRIENSSAICFEEENELWVKEYDDGRQREGRTYPVKFCPECGFKIPTVSSSKSYFCAIPDSSPDESITRFSQALSTAIAQMNHNVELIKCFMSSQNAHNQCFMDRDLNTSQEIFQLKKRIENLEKKL